MKPKPEASKPKPGLPSQAKPSRNITKFLRFHLICFFSLPSFFRLMIYVLGYGNEIKFFKLRKGEKEGKREGVCETYLHPIRGFFWAVCQVQ
jgi:hypothetical protein